MMQKFNIGDWVKTRGTKWDLPDDLTRRFDPRSGISMDGLVGQIIEPADDGYYRVKISNYSLLQCSYYRLIDIHNFSTNTYTSFSKEALWHGTHLLYPSDVELSIHKSNENQEGEEALKARLIISNYTEINSLGVDYSVSDFISQFFAVDHNLLWLRDSDDPKRWLARNIWIQILNRYVELPIAFTSKIAGEKEICNLIRCEYDEGTKETIFTLQVGGLNTTFYSGPYENSLASKVLFGAHFVLPQYIESGKVPFSKRILLAYLSWEFGVVY